jgi:hypothetical protein
LKNTVKMGYGNAASDGYFKRLTDSQRRKLFDAFTAFRQRAANGAVLNVGVAPSPLFDSTDFLLKWAGAEERARITSYGIALPARTTPQSRARSDAAEAHPQAADLLRLPFPDDGFDWVFCDEVIERTGSFDHQLALVKELTRVARKGVFVTTTNRWHPIEFNTGIPFVHWLPDAWWRRVLCWFGKSGWASPSVLRLLDSGALYKIANLLPASPRHDVGHKRVFGIKAHFFLMIDKCPGSGETSN